jgi:hypothetical protein
MLLDGAGYRAGDPAEFDRFAPDDSGLPRPLFVQIFGARVRRGTES